MTMSGTHTEAVLNRLTKPELAQLLLKTEAALAHKLLISQRKLKTLILILKSLKQTLLMLGLLKTGLHRRLSKQKGSAGKTFPMKHIRDYWHSKFY